MVPEDHQGVQPGQAKEHKEKSAFTEHLPFVGTIQSFQQPFNLGYILDKETDSQKFSNEPRIMSNRSRNLLLPLLVLAHVCSIIYLSNVLSMLHA